MRSWRWGAREALIVVLLAASGCSGGGGGGGSGNRPPSIGLLAIQSLLEDGEKVVDLTTFIVDPDGDSVAISIETPPDHGTVAVLGGSLRYTPEADFSGSDVVSAGLPARPGLREHSRRQFRRRRLAGQRGDKLPHRPQAIELTGELRIGLECPSHLGGLALGKLAVEVG